MRVEVVGVSAEEAAPFLARALARGDTSQGISSLGDLTRNALLCGVRNVETGDLVAAYAVRINRQEGGPVAWVTAAGGSADASLIDAILPEVEKQARADGCVQVAIETRRPGLVKKMKRAGFRPCSVVMRKGI